MWLRVPRAARWPVVRAAGQRCFVGLGVFAVVSRIALLGSAAPPVRFGSRLGSSLCGKCPSPSASHCTPTPPPIVNPLNLRSASPCPSLSRRTSRPTAGPRTPPAGMGSPPRSHGRSPRGPPRRVDVAAAVVWIPRRRPPHDHRTVVPRQALRLGGGRLCAAQEHEGGSVPELHRPPSRSASRSASDRPVASTGRGRSQEFERQRAASTAHQAQPLHRPQALLELVFAGLHRHQPTHPGGAPSNGAYLSRTFSVTGPMSWPVLYSQCSAPCSETNANCRASALAAPAAPCAP